MVAATCEYNFVLKISVMNISPTPPFVSFQMLRSASRIDDIQDTFIITGNLSILPNRGLKGRDIFTPDIAKNQAPLTYSMYRVKIGFAINNPKQLTPSYFLPSKALVVMNRDSPVFTHANSAAVATALFGI